MTTIKFESRIVSPAELQPYLQDSGLEYTTEQFTEPHRGAVESVLHFVTENKEAITILLGLSKAFNGWIAYQKLQLETRKIELEEAKDAREAEKHQTDMEEFDLLQKNATLRVSLKNDKVLILPNGTEEEIAQQIEREAPNLKPIQIKQMELK